METGNNNHIKNPQSIPIDWGFGDAIEILFIS